MLLRPLDHYAALAFLRKMPSQRAWARALYLRTRPALVPSR